MGTSITPSLTLYIEYVTKFHQGGELLRKLSKRRKFNKVLTTKCGHDSMVGLSGLETLRIVPVQRVPRYVLLLRDLLKVTEEDHPDYQPCSVAYSLMEKTTSLINEKKREYERAQRLAFISENLRGGNLGALRETLVNRVQEEHDFKPTTFTLPHTCNWCREVVHLQGYVCGNCKARVHNRCWKACNSSPCGVLEEMTAPELIKANRKIIREGFILHKATPMDRPAEYQKT